MLFVAAEKNRRCQGIKLYVPVTVHRERSVKKEYQQDVTKYMIYCQFQMLIIDYSLDMFRASLSGEKTTCYCICGIFAGSVGCGWLRFCGATL